jgi:hypothetical protein
MKTRTIARVCHEVNRAICEAADDWSQRPWDYAEAWQQDRAIRGVEFAIANLDTPESALHEAWMADKIAGGWSYGPTKDVVLKTHPWLVAYEHLPFEQRVKDHVLRAVVKALKD